MTDESPVILCELCRAPIGEPVQYRGEAYHRDCYAEVYA